MTIDVFHLFAASKENVIDTLRGTRHESEKHNDAMTCMHSSCFHSNDPPLPISRPLSVSDCVVSWLEWYRQKEVCRWKGCFFDLDMTHYYNATDWLPIRLASRVSLPLCSRAEANHRLMTWLRHMPNCWHISRWWHGRNIFPQWQYGVHKQLLCLDWCHQT